MLEVNASLLTEFRDFSKISTDNEEDSSLTLFLSSAVATVGRLCGKELADIEPTANIKLATFTLALDGYNQKDFPSRSVQESVNAKVLILIQDQIDLAARTVLTERETA